MAQEIVTYSLDEIDKAVNVLYPYLDSCKIFTFEGDLGAGKTTLIRAFLRKFGITEEVTSPTFTYVNIYENTQGQRFYHFDLYRLKELKEFYASGFQEYLYQPNSWALIEWPGIIESIVKKNICKIEILYESDDKRELIITSNVENS